MLSQPENACATRSILKIKHNCSPTSFLHSGSKPTRRAMVAATALICLYSKKRAKDPLQSPSNLGDQYAESSWAGAEADPSPRQASQNSRSNCGRTCFG